MRCILRDPQNRTDPVALLEDIQAIPHVSEFRTLGRIEQLDTMNLVMTLVLGAMLQAQQEGLAPREDSNRASRRDICG